MASIEDAIREMDERIKILKSGEILQRTVRGMMGIMAHRIFEDGKDSKGAKIGKYDNKKEIWINPDTLPTSPAPKGKPNASRRVANRSSTYFPSYRAMRKEIGRESGFINLRLTNDLQSDFANADVAPSRTSIGNKYNPHKINSFTYAIKLTRQVNREKRKGLEKRFGKIFDMTKDETRKFNEALTKEFLLLHAK